MVHTDALEHSLEVSYKTNIFQQSPYNPAITFLGILPKRIENVCPKNKQNKKKCTWIFIAALFIIAKFGSNQYVLQ